MALLLTAAHSPPGARAEVFQQGAVRVKVSGAMAPSSLPRHALAPVAVSFGGRISSLTPGEPPQLRRLTIAINRHGRLFTRGLPVCRLREIEPSITREALAACRPALVGAGRFSANVNLPEQSPFPSKGKLLAFNGVVSCQRDSSLSELSLERHAARERLLPGAGRLWPSRSRTQGGLERGASKHRNLIPLRSERSAISYSGERTSIPGRGNEGARSPVVRMRPSGSRGDATGALRDPQAGDRGHRAAQCHKRPAILAHIYGPEPVPTSYVLPFLIRRSHGTYGTILDASLPQATGDWGNVTAITLTLRRRYRWRGRPRSYLSASCPAPAGFPGATFPLVHTGFAFPGVGTVGGTLVRHCRAGG